MTTLSVNIHDQSNLGDKVCNPCDYFPELSSFPREDAWALNWIYWMENIILGGGGMVHNLLEHLIRNMKRTPDRKLIAWGLGHNRDGANSINYDTVLDGFDLVGVRDFKTAEAKGWDYVPCVSCLDENFKHSYSFEYDYVVYQHFNNPIKLRNTERWHFVASNDLTNIGDAVAFLRLGETVITNSYHGAYWAMLLGRKVLLYKPFSSRFVDFKYQPPAVDEFSWKTTEGISAPKGYLEECRSLNLAYCEKVKTILGLSDTVKA